MNSEVLEYEIINRETKYKGFSKLEEVTVKHGDTEFKREVFDRGNAAAALVYNTETNKFLFVEQYRPGADGVTVEIVAGGIDDGEKPQDTVKREIAEELGYKVDKLTHITDCYVSPGANTEVTAIFYAEVSEKIGEGGGIDNENIKIVEVDELGLNGNLFFSIPEDGNIVPPYKLIDAKSIIAVSWFMTSKLMKSLWETISDYKMKSL
ncbi:MAG: NUDIX domain-containing protein [bacterium]|jgi:nudix-type nucleoside diphosphatase (YffH/AdpP family)